MTQDNYGLAIEFSNPLTAVAAAISFLRADTAHFNGNGCFRVLTGRSQALSDDLVVLDVSDSDALLA